MLFLTSPSCRYAETGWAVLFRYPEIRGWRWIWGGRKMIDQPDRYCFVYCIIIVDSNNNHNNNHNHNHNHNAMEAVSSPVMERKKQLPCWASPVLQLHQQGKSIALIITVRYHTISYSTSLYYTSPVKPWLPFFLSFSPNLPWLWFFNHNSQNNHPSCSPAVQRYVYWSHYGYWSGGGEHHHGSYYRTSSMYHGYGIDQQTRERNRETASQLANT